MNLEQKVHGIGIAFATCKMNSRDNSSDDEVDRQAQLLDFTTDYPFAVNQLMEGMHEIDNLSKDR